VIALNDDLQSILDTLRNEIKEITPDLITLNLVTVLVTGFGEFGADVVRVLNDFYPPYYLYLIDATSINDLKSAIKKILIPKYAFLVFRLESLDMLSTMEGLVRYLSNISDTAITMVSIPAEVSNEMDSTEIVARLKNLSAYSSIFLIEEIAISDNQLCMDPKYIAEDIVIECIKTILYATVITPSGSYFHCIDKFFAKKGIGLLNYFIVDLEEFENPEIAFMSFMKLPIKNIEQFRIYDALLFCNFNAEETTLEELSKILSIITYISDKLDLCLPPLGNMYEKDLIGYIGIATFVLLENESLTL